MKLSVLRQGLVFDCVFLDGGKRGYLYFIPPGYKLTEPPDKVCKLFPRSQRYPPEFVDSSDRVESGERVKSFVKRE